jgi:hypothetical protein
MGKCISTKENSIEASKPSSRDQAKPNTGTTSKAITIHDHPLPERFKDMPEIEDRFVGDGVRRMNAYKCDLKIDQLQKLQEEFWSNKTLTKMIEC